VLTQQIIDAGEAKALGVISEIVPRDRCWIRRARSRDGSPASRL
jgi:enoyl-CoA hydratase/carnithine racemase